MSHSWKTGTILCSPCWWILKWTGISSLLHPSVKGQSLSRYSFMFTGDFFPGLNECLELNRAYKTTFWEGIGKMGGGESASHQSAWNIQTPICLHTYEPARKALKTSFSMDSVQTDTCWELPLYFPKYSSYTQLGFFLIHGSGGVVKFLFL